MTAPGVLIISGPIASGKSTVAYALAAEARAAGSSAAVVELDRIYMMLDDGPIMSDAEISRRAGRAAAALVDHYVLDGLDLVIAEGDFWTMGQRDEFTYRLSSSVVPVFVTLRVSEEEALRRVGSDAGRRLSRNPAVVRRCHADFAAAPPIAGDVTIDSTSLSVAEVAACIRSVLDRSDAAGTPGREPLFRDVDCVQIPVSDLQAGLAFYRDALGHQLIWRTDTAAGLRIGASATELVVQTERPELEPNLSVASADDAARLFVAAGGTLLVAPFDIAIGRCAVVQDRWSNRLVLLDHSKGRLLTDAAGNVETTGTRKP